MDHQVQACYTAFAGHTRLISGSLAEVAVASKAALDRDNTEALLIFENQTSTVIELNFRGTVEDVVGRIPEIQRDRQEESPPKKKPMGPGRPKLGVVAREVTLLPRHWEWLKNQQGGASVTLRRLIDQERRDNKLKYSLRDLQTSVYQFMTVIGGDLPGFEEALRALYADNRVQFFSEVDVWPTDIRDHVIQLAKKVFDFKNPQE